MVHVMKLQSAPFELIANKKKTVELRLNDEKRKQICVGDTILFLHSEDSKYIINVTVTSMVVAADFSTLFKIVTLEECGCSKTDTYPDMSKYYSLEQQLVKGVVSIRFELNHVSNLTNVDANFDEFKLIKSANKVCSGSVLKIAYDNFNNFRDSYYGVGGFEWCIDYCCSFSTTESDDGFSEIYYDDLEIVMSIMRDIKCKRDLITVVNSIAIPYRCRLEIVREECLEFVNLDDNCRYILSKNGVLSSAAAVSPALEKCFDKVYEKVYKVSRIEMLAARGLLP